VDGGSSKTIALIADDRGQVLGAGRSLGSNWTGEDVEIPMGVVAQAAREALRQAGAEPRDVALGVFTLSGADWPEDHTRRAVVLAQSNLAQQVIVKNDAFGVLRAGTSSPYGMVIAAGTGAMTAVITPDGREWHYGYYQNYGGASDLSREILEAVLRAEAGMNPPTHLTRRVLQALDFPNVDDLLRALIAERIPEGDRLRLCPLAFEAAAEGDHAAAKLLAQHGAALAEYAAALIRRFEMQPLAFDLVLGGSLFKGRSPLLVDSITLAVHHAAPQARIVLSRFEPVIGSVLLALDALKIPAGEAVLERLSASQPGQDFFDTTTK